MHRHFLPEPLAVVLCIAAVAHTFGQQPLIQRETPLEPPANHGGIVAFAFSPDGTRLAGGTAAIDITINGRKSRQGCETVLWDVERGMLLKTLGNHGASVTWLKFSEDGNTLVSASREDGTIKIWQMPDGTLLDTLKTVPVDKSVQSQWPRLVLSADGATLVSVSPKVIHLDENTKLVTGGELAVWDVKSGKQLWSQPESNVYAVALTSNGRGMVTVNVKYSGADRDDASRMRSEQSLNSWNVKTQKLLKSVAMNRGGSPESVALVDPNTVAILSSSGFSTHNRKTGDETNSFEWDKKRRAGKSFLATDGKTVGRTGNGWTELVDVASGISVALTTTEFPNHYRELSFSPDLTWAACQHSHKPVVLHLTRNTVVAAE